MFNPFMQQCWKLAITHDKINLKCEHGNHICSMFKQTNMLFFWKFLKAVRRSKSHISWNVIKDQARKLFEFNKKDPGLKLRKNDRAMSVH